MRVIEMEPARHAVVGGDKPKRFALAATAEFFRLTTDTLYSDKPLAVVREVLCNAWDAHIEAGRTDVPVCVTVNEDELSIRDYGTGIPDDQMADRYATIGGSTKTGDARQTGGFGLGCKAPFCYTDFFTVVSHCGGERRVYAASRGSLESEGFPEIRCMVRSATAETGLEVKVPLKRGFHEASKFADLVRRVARNGGMNVTINGEGVAPRDYSGIERRGYIWRSGAADLGLRFKVKVGSVIYPLSSDDERIADVISALKRTILRGVFTLEDVEHRVVPVPSREALSYTERGVEVIVAILTRILKDYRAALPAVESAFVEHYADECDLESLLLRRRALPRRPASECSADMSVIAAHCRATGDLDHLRRALKLMARRDRYAGALYRSTRESKHGWTALVQRHVRATAEKIVRRAGAAGKLIVVQLGAHPAPITAETDFVASPRIIYVAERQSDIKAVLVRRPKEHDRKYPAVIALCGPDVSRDYEALRREAARFDVALVRVRRFEQRPISAAPARPKKPAVPPVKRFLVHGSGAHVEMATCDAVTDVVVRLVSTSKGYKASNREECYLKVAHLVAPAVNVTVSDAAYLRAVNEGARPLKSVVEAYLATNIRNVSFLVGYHAPYTSILRSLWRAGPARTLKLLGFPGVAPDEDAFAVAEPFKHQIYTMMDHDPQACKTYVKIRSNALKLRDVMCDEGLVSLLDAAQGLANDKLRDKVIAQAFARIESAMKESRK